LLSPFRPFLPQDLKRFRTLQKANKELQAALKSSHENEAALSLLTKTIIQVACQCCRSTTTFNAMSALFSARSCRPDIFLAGKRAGSGIRTRGGGNFGEARSRCHPDKFAGHLPDKKCLFRIRPLLTLPGVLTVATTTSRVPSPICPLLLCVHGPIARMVMV
jgi:hypothetical protein